MAEQQQQQQAGQHKMAADITAVLLDLLTALQQRTELMQSSRTSVF